MYDLSKFHKHICSVNCLQPASVIIQMDLVEDNAIRTVGSAAVVLISPEEPVTLVLRRDSMDLLVTVNANNVNV